MDEFLDEASTCRAYVIPKLTEADWYLEPQDVIEQKTFTDGRIVAAYGKVKRRHFILTRAKPLGKFFFAQRLSSPY